MSAPVLHVIEKLGPRAWYVFPPARPTEGGSTVYRTVDAVAGPFDGRQQAMRAASELAFRAVVG